MKAIRSLFLGVMFLFLANRASAQDLEPYKKDSIGGLYDKLFQSAEAKESFRQQREFLDERQSLYEALREEAKKYVDDPTPVADYENAIGEIRHLINGKKDDEELEVDYNTLYPGGYSSNPTVRQSVGSLRTLLPRYETRLREKKARQAIAAKLAQNISYVKADIDKCQRQLNNTLAPEYKQQSFRKAISITFSALIGLLLVTFFFIVYKKSDNKLSEQLLGGQGLQFITLFVLIIAVILFGILGILGSSELAAILSGISGYILGKGVTKEGQPVGAETPPSPPPPPPPVVIPQSPPVAVDLTKEENQLQ